MASQTRKNPTFDGIEMAESIYTEPSREVIQHLGKGFFTTIQTHVEMTPKQIAEEASRNADMLSDPMKRKEWIDSLAFRIEEYSQQ